MTPKQKPNTESVDDLRNLTQKYFLCYDFLSSPKDHAYFAEMISQAFLLECQIYESIQSDKFEKASEYKDKIRGLLKKMNREIEAKI